MPSVLLIDNYDSFTYNLVQAFLVLGAEVDVHRNDQIEVAEALDMEPSHLVISPGPGRPENAGVSLAMIEAFEGRVPVLGVCLGHQCLADAFGGKVVHAGEIMHGKTSRINHDGKGVFAGVPDRFEAVRYHSLAIEPESLPEELEVTARTDNGIIMGVRHRKYAIEGMQFHPESIVTPAGKQLLQNFLDMKETGADG